ncbi:MAG: hypothetical protein MR388_04155, partial [Tenericutes bacterium]|nr:hypothetical protein [Mycoplasmatota bacterium]
TYSRTLTYGTWDIYVKTLDNANNWYSTNWTHYTYYVNVCGSTRYSASNGHWGSCSADCGGGTQYYYENRTYYSNLTGEYCGSSSNVNTGRYQSCNTGSCGGGGHSCCGGCVGCYPCGNEVCGCSTSWTC